MDKYFTLLIVTLKFVIFIYFLFVFIHNLNSYIKVQFKEIINFYQRILIYINRYYVSYSL